MNANGCVHLDDYKSPQNLKNFKVVHETFVMCATKEARKSKTENAYCYICHRRGSLMHACLHCVFFGCHRHIREHCRTVTTPPILLTTPATPTTTATSAATTTTTTGSGTRASCAAAAAAAVQQQQMQLDLVVVGQQQQLQLQRGGGRGVVVLQNRHLLSMELGYGQVHCAGCWDYVYDAELDGIALVNKYKAAYCKKRQFNWTSWVPSPEERELFRYNPKRVCVGADSTRGLRGLLNLGATCFMNSIVQALMHTPLLRDYFLAERHKCAKAVCLVCDFARLFQEFYRGVHIPLALDRMLYLLWTHAHHLAAYEQQDAHECFIATLDLLHLHCAQDNNNTINNNNGSNNNNNNNNNGVAAGGVNNIGGGGGEQGVGSGGDGITKCPCIIDQIFTGGLQSDLVCQTCSGVSTKIDPIWDISLELNPVTVEGLPLSTLTDCLEVFTRAERLTSNVHCSSCQSSQETTKQLTLKTLPIVVCIHLKRFEHARKIDTSGKKISTLISFPETLDMTPFMSDRPKSKRPNLNSSSSRLGNSVQTTQPVLPPSDNKYSLFAVVSHSGTIHSGHYIAYVRQQRDYWYTCDDHVITRTTLREVLASEGYLLFYHKHTLDYD